MSKRLAVALAFAGLASALFSFKPIHMDEPLFLAPARHIAADPLHPLDFQFNWYGRNAPMASLNNTPPLMLYALAAGWKLSGGSERLMRLLFVPVDLAAAFALYGLASLFLSEPLWPTLVVLAGPGWLIDMTLLYPERLAAALGLLGLYLLALVLEEGRRRWFWPSAALCGLAVFAKYGAVFLLPTAVYYGWRRRAPAARLAAWCGAAAAPILAYLVYDRLTYHAAVGSVVSALAQSLGQPTASPAHRLRAILSFIGGCGLVTAAWPFALAARRRLWLALAAISVILFLPAFDVAPLVRLVDRATGAALAFGALAALAALAARERKGGGPLWAPWVASVLGVQALLYWSVLARVVALLMPPLVFALAEELEERWPPARLRRLYAASLAGVVAVTGALSWVDWRYAAAQRDAAAYAAARHPGARLWCAGHWGLQYYVEKEGGRELDGGWDQVRPGDVVLVPRVNSNVLRPARKVPADVETILIDESVPLRLISGYTGEGGFYSSITGFLPYSLSREPLDEFDIVLAR